MKDGLVLVLLKERVGINRRRATPFPRRQCPLGNPVRTETGGAVPPADPGGKPTKGLYRLPEGGQGDARYFRRLPVASTSSPPGRSANRWGNAFRAGRQHRVPATDGARVPDGG